MRRESEGGGTTEGCGWIELLSQGRLGKRAAYRMPPVLFRSTEKGVTDCGLNAAGPLLVKFILSISVLYSERIG